MQKYTDVITSARTGAAIPNARVTVKTYPGEVAATIYSDDGITQLSSNVLTTDSNGSFSFYAADGRYSLTVSGTGITERTISDILLQDPDDGTAEQDAADVAFAQSGSGAVPRTAQDRFRDSINVLDFFTAAQIADVRAFTYGENVSSAVATAFAAVPAGGALRFPYGGYLGLFPFRKSAVTLIFEGPTLKHPAGSPGNVLELGDLASGNGATAYEKLNIVGQVLIDGNKTNVTAPSDDLTGWGFSATQISNSDWGTGIRVKNCHNGGVGAFINSNYNNGHFYVESCGNATHTGPGFDVNSSSYNEFSFISKDCHIGGRVLDNCFGNIVRGTVKNPTSHGFVYNNQNVGQNNTNSIDVVIEDAGGHGFVWGPNCKNSNVKIVSTGAADQGMSMAVQSTSTETFDGSSAVVVDTTDNEITVTAHGWLSGTEVMYSDGGGTAITGLTDGGVYYIIRVDDNTVKLAESQAMAAAGTAVDLTAVGVGSSHTLTSDFNCTGNIIDLATRRSANAGVYLGGNGNILRHASYLDGRGGAVGDSFAVDVNGNSNTLVVNLVDSNSWKVRGIAVRSGASDNEILSYTYTNTLDPYNDAGTRTRFSRGTLQGDDLASVSGELTLPLFGSVFNLTGSNTVTSIAAAGNKGRTVTLITTSSAALTDGSNLKLASSFSGGADDTITLACDGTNWYEVCRSVN